MLKKVILILWLIAIWVGAFQASTNFVCATTIDANGSFMDDQGNVRGIILNGVSFSVEKEGEKWLEFKVQNAYHEEDKKPINIRIELEQILPGYNKPVVIVEGKYKLEPEIFSLTKIYFVETSTFLHYAARNGFTNLAEQLIIRGANVNVRDKRGYTPLHLAVIKNNIRLAKILIALGADVNAKNSIGAIPLHYAAHDDEQITLVREMVAVGADLHARDAKGRTSLHYAANTGQIIIFRELVAAGADINTMDAQGRTLLNSAEIAYENYLRLTKAKILPYSPQTNNGYQQIIEFLKNVGNRK